MDIVFLIAYVVLLAVGYWRSRSLAWMVIVLAGTAGVVGAGINFALDRGHFFTRVELQWLLVAVLAIVVVLAFVPKLGFSWKPQSRPSGLGLRRQFLAIWIPVLVVLGLIVLVTVFWTSDPAFLHPVGYLIGHGTAEDNAKWLDFTSQFASGLPIHQAVPMGGPLELLLTFVGTVMGVVSSAALGGYNQVAVAANSVIYGEYLMVALVPFALAPLAESVFKGRRIPAPFVVAGAAVLSITALVVIGYGHLTFQFTLLVTGLWSATFLSGIRIPRARLITSLAAAASMTVWLPLNVVAIVIVAGWGIALIVRGIRGGWRRFDLVGFVLLAIVTIGVAQPVYSSVSYLLIGTAPEPSSMGASALGIATAVGAGLADSTLFAASGGTEQLGPILGILAVVSVVAAALMLKSAVGRRTYALYLRFLPIGILAFFALAIYSLDFWSTGSGPHYGSMKFTFLVGTMALGTTLPIALLAIDSQLRERMSPARWIAIGGVVILLMVDSILPRAIALARPEQWSPPIPFNNTSGSYWWPADVNGTGKQDIATNPVACVYLPPGAKVPSAIVPSGLSDPQRVYSCTRQLAGLSGVDTTAQPLVDWLRREWFTNTPAWSDVYESLTGMSPDVLAKPVILLDEGSNVVGLSSMGELLQRYPKTAGQ